MRKVYTIGDCVLDLFFENDKPVEAKPGGSFLNSAVSLGRLGVKISLISELGVDRVGKTIRKFLVENNVGIEHISQFSNTNSNLALAFLDENKNADYSFYKTRKGMPSCIKFPDDIKRNDIILFGSFLAIRKEFRADLHAFLKDCRKKGALIIYDPNFRAQHLPLLDEVLPFIKENMKLAHVVKASNEDFQLICRTENSNQSYQWLKEFSDALLMYTANKDGVFVYAKEEHYYPVPKITPVSTVGAGDTFNAAIAYYLVRNGIGVENLESLSAESIQELVNIAVQFSQEVCMGYDNFLQENFAAKFRI